MRSDQNFKCMYSQIFSLSPGKQHLTRYFGFKELLISFEEFENHTIHCTPLPFARSALSI